MHGNVRPVVEWRLMGASLTQTPTSDVGIGHRLGIPDQPWMLVSLIVVDDVGMPISSCGDGLEVQIR